MAEIWESTFLEKELIWGLDPTQSAIQASERFAKSGAKNVLIPGIGYGRNAKPFLAQGMSVTGIEISETAIKLARERLGLDVPIHHGSVTDMPYDDRRYDGIFCYGLLYLLDAPGRAKLLRDCHAQLTDGGQMIFSVVAKNAPMYRRGTRLDDDWYELVPGVRLYFYDAVTIAREFRDHGLVDVWDTEEPAHGGPLPFINVACKRG